MLVEEKWFHGYLENVWYIPYIGRQLPAAEHGMSRDMSSWNVNGFFQRDLRLEDRHVMHIHVMFPREPAVFNVATAS
jgi:hypothetical protein